LSSETRNTSPARKPSLANRRSIARLRLSRALSDGHNVSTKSSCSDERWRGIEACRDPEAGHRTLQTCPNVPFKSEETQQTADRRDRTLSAQLESLSARLNTKPATRSALHCPSTPPYLRSFRPDMLEGRAMTGSFQPLWSRRPRPMIETRRHNGHLRGSGPEQSPRLAVRALIS
jgi:hypothetical protein